MISLIEEEKVSLVFADNPYIKQFPSLSIKDQIHKLTSNIESLGVYPAKKHLKNAVNATNYITRPYSHELSLGCAQLEFRAFNMSILENYRNDPRYYYENNAIGGRISIVDEHYSSKDMCDQDKVHLQTFGFCYDDNNNRAIAVFLRYLKQLSSNHQQTWKTKELDGKWNLHPDYRRFSLGDWNIGISIFDAFIEELKAINKMCKAMQKPQLFKKTFEEEIPKEFSFLIRPTTKEFYQFIHLLDKMISDNINTRFFESHIDNSEIEDKNKDGTKKGSMALLESWLEKFYKVVTEEKNPYKKLLSPFKEIRKQRTIPGHKIEEDEFDPEFITKQQNILLKAYESLSILRMIFNRHPNCINNNFGISARVLEGRIWTQ